MKKNNAVFITVRTGSTRLPKKSLLRIHGKTTIEFVIERAKRSGLKDVVVLCTTVLQQDNVLCDVAKKCGIQFFRGSVKDKLMRWHGAAQKYDVGFFVTADGDDLFCEPELMDIAFKQYQRSKADFIEGKGLICGSFTYGIKAAALKKVCEIKATDDTEMMWTYFKDTDLFKLERLMRVPKMFQRPDIRMTLDYQEDFEFFSKIVDDLGADGKFFNLREITQYLNVHPEVIRINQFRQQEFLDNQKRKTSLVLKNSSK